jgi:hypothetical protein
MSEQCSFCQKAGPSVLHVTNGVTSVYMCSAQWNSLLDDMFYGDPELLEDGYKVEPSGCEETLGLSRNPHGPVKQPAVHDERREYQDTPYSQGKPSPPTM